jgi:hypothetical protein
MGEDVRPGAPSPGVRTFTIDQNEGNQAGKMLDALEDTKSSYMGRVGVPWVYDVLRGDSIQRWLTTQVRRVGLTKGM